MSSAGRGGLVLGATMTVLFVLWAAYVGFAVDGSKISQLVVAVGGFLLGVFFIGFGLSRRVRNPY